MLRPEQISNAQFTLVGKGAYRAEEVDAFLKSVAASYRESTETNEELISKISILADRIEQYREDEDTIKATLISAQRMAKTIHLEAEDEKKATIAAAEAESSSIIEEAKQNSKDLILKTKATIDAYKEKAKKESDEAIGNAKAEAEQTVKAANEEAEKTIAEANEKAERIIGDSESKAKKYSAEYKKLKEEIETCKAVLSDLCEKQRALIETIPNFDSAEDKVALIENVEAAIEPVVLKTEEEILDSEEEISDPVIAVSAAEADADASEPVQAAEEAEEDVITYVPETAQNDDFSFDYELPETENADEAEVIAEPEISDDTEAKAEEIAEKAEDAEDVDEFFNDIFKTDEDDASVTTDFMNDIESILSGKIDDEDFDTEEDIGFKIDLEGIDDNDPAQTLFSGFFD